LRRQISFKLIHIKISDGNHSIQMPRLLRVADMFHRLLLAVSACSLAAACSSDDRQSAVPTGASNESACTVQREAEARRRGRLGPEYDQVLIARDAREDCTSYGLVSGSAAFERCVQQEISYRRRN
jgi:hypothetical protein